MIVKWSFYIVMWTNWAKNCIFRVTDHQFWSPSRYKLQRYTIHSDLEASNFYLPPRSSFLHILSISMDKMHQIKETNITLKSKFLRSTSFHFKCPKNAPCLWFGHFSSDVKCCTHTCLQHFTWELKCTNQSCRSQRVAFSKWCCFLIRCILAMLSTLSWILYEGRNFTAKRTSRTKPVLVHSV